MDVHVVAVVVRVEDLLTRRYRWGPFWRAHPQQHDGVLGGKLCQAVGGGEDPLWVNEDTATLDILDENLGKPGETWNC